MRIMTLTNRVYSGTPEEILKQMRKTSKTKHETLRGFMRNFARRCHVLKPVAKIRSNDPVYLLVDAAAYGFIKLLPDHEEPKFPDKTPKGLYPVCTPVVISSQNSVSARVGS